MSHINSVEECLHLECSFLDLRCKEVVNVVDGKRLGHITDVIFDLNCCRLIGFIVPGNRSIWNVFRNGSEIFIPVHQICKIGTDTILVELYGVKNPHDCRCLSGPPPTI